MRCQLLGWCLSAAPAQQGAPSRVRSAPFPSVRLTERLQRPGEDAGAAGHTGLGAQQVPGRWWWARGYMRSFFRLPPPHAPPSLASLSQHLYNLRVSGFCRASPGAEGITVAPPCLC